MSNVSLGSKCAIIGFWLGIIAFFLYIAVPTNYIIERLFGERNVLHVYTFTDTISIDAVRAFEKQTGIRVYLHFFEANDDLFAKLRINSGRGADVVVVTDYMIEVCARHQLLRSLDHTRIDAWNQLDPRLVGLPCDPTNTYAVPVSWSFYGLAYQKDFFGSHTPSSWADIFEPANYTIVVPNDVRDMVFFAGQYLFGKSENFTPSELTQIKELLIRQKAWVDSYMTDRSLYALEAGIVPLTIMFGSSARRLVTARDTIGFTIPKQGSMLIIEHFALSAACEHENAAYAFINFILQPAVTADIVSQSGYNPSNQAAYALLDQSLVQNQNFFPVGDVFNSLRLLTSTVPGDQLEHIWLSVKTA